MIVDNRAWARRRLKIIALFRASRMNLNFWYVRVRIQGVGHERKHHCTTRKIEESLLRSPDANYGKRWLHRHQNGPWACNCSCCGLSIQMTCKRPVLRQICVLMLLLRENSYMVWQVRRCSRSSRWPGIIMNQRHIFKAFIWTPFS